MDSKLFTEFSKEVDKLSTMITGCIKMLENVESNELKLAFVLTLFDHVCETSGFDKAKVCDFYRKTNSVIGDMYEKDEDK